MPTLIKSISGIRGIVGDGLDPQHILKFSAAFAEFCNYGKIVVGRDSRISGGFINNLVIGTLNSLGCEVYDLGICPTPTVQIYVEHLKANGGIAITASHNPNEWNALKLLNSSGMFLSLSEANDYFNIADKIQPSSHNIAMSWQAYRKWNEIGKYHYINDSWQLHLDKLYTMELVDIENIRNRRFKILLDCVNGAGINVVPKLLSDLNCEITKINCEESGIFPRNPEPIPENLTETISIAKNNSFDLTIIVDPDVDRLVLLTDKGEPFGEENTIAQVVKFVLGKKKGNVCINLSTTRAVEDIAEEFGCKVYRTPVGEINVVSKMRETNAVIGGEGSGGVICPALHLGRDALVGIILTLQNLAEYGKSISELKNQLPRYSIKKEKYDLSNVDADEILIKLKQKFRDEKINTDDGLRIDFEDHWVHLRKSNTEPIIRLIVEARSSIEAKGLMSKYKKLIAESE